VSRADQESFLRSKKGGGRGLQCGEAKALVLGCSGVGARDPAARPTHERGPPHHHRHLESNLGHRLAVPHLPRWCLALTQQDAGTVSKHGPRSAAAGRSRSGNGTIGIISICPLARKSGVRMRVPGRPQNTRACAWAANQARAAAQFPERHPTIQRPWAIEASGSMRSSFDSGRCRLPRAGAPARAEGRAGTPPAPGPAALGASVKKPPRGWISSEGMGREEILEKHGEKIAPFITRPWDWLPRLHRSVRAGFWDQFSAKAHPIPVVLGPC